MPAQHRLSRMEENLPCFCAFIIYIFRIFVFGVFHAAGAPQANRTTSAPVIWILSHISHRLQPSTFLISWALSRKVIWSNRYHSRSWLLYTIFRPYRHLERMLFFPTAFWSFCSLTFLIISMILGGSQFVSRWTEGVDTGRFVRWFLGQFNGGLKCSLQKRVFLFCSNVTFSAALQRSQSCR